MTSVTPYLGCGVLASNSALLSLPSLTLDPSSVVPFGQRRCMMLTLFKHWQQIEVKTSKGLLIESKDFSVYVLSEVSVSSLAHLLTMVFDVCR